jgi:hypothetical protein
MFEKEIDRVRKQLKQRLDTRQPSTSLAAILANANIHPSYRAFFKAEAEWWLYEERALRASNPRFDTSAPELQSVFPKLDELYLGSARFDHEELNATIDAAVKTRLNFLCRPRTTLKWFVYRGEPTKPLHEVLMRLNYLTDNAYLLDGIRQWAATRPAEASSYEILSVIEFERIVEKVDNDAILDLSQDEFVRLLDGLYGFFYEADPNLPSEAVPTEAVIIFLDDKGAIPISQALERLLYREELRTLTRSKLIDVINDVIASIGTSDFVESSPEQSEGPQTAETVETIESSPEQSEGPETVESSPEQSEGPHAAQRVAKFIAQLDASTKERIVKKIFSRDHTQFDHTVQEILRRATWREAAGELDRWFARQGVAPDSAAAMEFAQAMHRSYL